VDTPAIEKKRFTMSWGTRHDGEIPPGSWDLSEGYLRCHAAFETRRSKRHGPSGEAAEDDGAGNPSPREEESRYGLDDEEQDEMPDEADDWTSADR
jgi:hypothetical protein